MIFYALFYKIPLNFSQKKSIACRFFVVHTTVVKILIITKNYNIFDVFVPIMKECYIFAMFYFKNIYDYISLNRH